MLPVALVPALRYLASRVFHDSSRHSLFFLSSLVFRASEQRRPSAAPIFIFTTVSRACRHQPSGLA